MRKNVHSIEIHQQIRHIPTPPSQYMVVGPRGASGLHALSAAVMGHSIAVVAAQTQHLSTEAKIARERRSKSKTASSGIVQVSTCMGLHETANASMKFYNTQYLHAKINVLAPKTISCN